MLKQWVRDWLGMKPSHETAIEETLLQAHEANSGA